MMRYDWLFGMPHADWKTQESLVAQALRDDPTAAAITDEEAEGFFCAAHMLRSMDQPMSAKLCKALRLRNPGGYNKKVHRRATVLMLRRWKEPHTREFLEKMIPNILMNGTPDVATQPEAWTDEGFARAYRLNVPVVWLARIRRYLGKGDQIETWLDTLDRYAARNYRLCLDYSRVTIRRLVYPEAAPPPAASQTAAARLPDAAGLAQELHAKNQATSTLRQHVRRLEQDRKRLREQNRRAQLQAKAMLAQARGEVAAARQALKDEQAAWAKGLADQARQYERQIAALRQEIAGAQAEFCRSLEALSAASAARPLRGRTFTLSLADSRQADEPACRLLAESLGATVVPAGGETLPAPAESLAGLERQLRRAALQQVLIKCDGLYRRKADRPGIAVSAFEVHAGGEVICRGGDVTCSGGAAGSLMAEYGAAALALRWLHDVGPAPGSRAEIWIDCRPLVHRLHRREARQTKRGCIQLDRAALRLLRELRQQACDVQIRWVPRDEVYAVDRLCDLIYRESTWYHRRRQPTYDLPLRRFLRSARLKP